MDNLRANATNDVCPPRVIAYVAPRAENSVEAAPGGTPEEAAPETATGPETPETATAPETATGPETPETATGPETAIAGNRMLFLHD